MANSYNWKINNLEVLPESNGQQNIVYRAQWTLSVTDGVNSFTMGDSVDIVYDENSDFVSYEYLTESKVISWVHNILGSETVAKYQSDIDEILLTMPQPDNKLSLPWINQ